MISSLSNQRINKYSIPHSNIGGLIRSSHSFLTPEPFVVDLVSWVHKMIPSI